MSATAAKRKPKSISAARSVTVKPSNYQPSRAELREEIDMPKMSLTKVRRAFFRPFRFEPK